MSHGGPAYVNLYHFQALPKWTSIFFGKLQKASWNARTSNKPFWTFKQFLDKQGFTYETQTEKELEEAYLNSEKDDLQNAISTEYANLMKAIDATKKKELDAKENEISNLIIDELVKRYFYRQGLYEYQINHNEEIAEAANIVNDASRYRKILNQK